MNEAPDVSKELIRGETIRVQGGKKKEKKSQTKRKRERKQDQKPQQTFLSPGWKRSGSRHGSAEASSHTHADRDTEKRDTAVQRVPED